MRNEERRGRRRFVIGLIAGALLAAPIGAAVADVWHPDFDESWAKAVALDCIEGDPLYYSRGVAEQSEVNHALVTCITNAIEAGIEGVPGPAGPAGADGADGPQGPAGADGAQGPQGPAGADGADGPQGPAGADGADGPQGPQGPAGADGADGADGPQGPQGPAGADGADGADGQNGLADILRVEGTATSSSAAPSKTATATCPVDRILVGGGALVATAGSISEISITESYPSSTTVWTARGDANVGAPPGNWSIQAFALCALQ